MQRPTPIVQVPVPPPTPGRVPQLTLKPTARATILPPARAPSPPVAVRAPSPPVTVRAPSPPPVGIRGPMIVPGPAPPPAIPKITLPTINPAPRAPSPQRLPTVPRAPSPRLPIVTPIIPTVRQATVPAIPKVTLPPLTTTRATVPTPVPIRPPTPKKTIVPRYPYTQKQIAECSLDDDGNIIDPITQEPILPGRLVSFEEGKTYYCFDISTLYKEVRQGRTYNPFTRQPLSKKVLDRVQAYKKELEVRVLPMMQYNVFTIDRDRPLGELVLDLIRAMSMDLKAITKYNFFVGDDSVYDLDLNKSLEEQKLFTEETPTEHHQVLIIPERDPTDRRIRAMYQYLKMYGPTGTMSSFLQEFPQVEPPEDRQARLDAEREVAREAELAARTPPRRTQRAVSPPRLPRAVSPPRLPRAVSPPRQQVPRQPMDRDTAMGIVAVLNEDFANGEPPREIIQTAYDALRNYTVTADIAHEMENALNPDLRRELHQVPHIIYASVSDKNNLRVATGVEGYYARRPQGPNYYNVFGREGFVGVNLY